MATKKTVKTAATKKVVAKTAAKKAAPKTAAPARKYNNDKTIKVIAGNLGKDPMSAVTQKGQLFAYFPVAVNGEDGATWYQVNAWGRLAEVAMKWLSKGRFVKVEGRFQEETFVGQDGKKHTVKKIVASRIRFLDAKPEEA